LKQDISELRTLNVIINLMMEPTVVVEWLKFLLRNWESPGLDLGPETCYLGWCFSWFSSFPPDEFWDITLKLGHGHFFHFLSNSSSIYHPFIRCCTV
jgi:hypothetical protein